MEPKQKKMQTNLLISGTTLIAFALLDAIQLVIYWAIDPIQSFILELIFATNVALGWIIVGLIGGGTLLEVILACYIGFSARSEAKGKKRNIVYIVIAIILASVLFVSSVFSVIKSFLSEINVFSIIESFISAGFSFVVVYCLVDIIVCSLKNRKMNKNKSDTVTCITTTEEVNV